jgi:hypothetical protein
MSSDELPPHPPACLERPYPSSQKGGTLIAEQVRDLEAHLEQVSDPDGYRPARCPHCGHGVLHAHDHRARKLRGDRQWGPEIVVRQLPLRVVPGALADLAAAGGSVVVAELACGGANGGLERAACRAPCPQA